MIEPKGMPSLFKVIPKWLCVGHCRQGTTHLGLPQGWHTVLVNADGRHRGQALRWIFTQWLPRLDPAHLAKRFLLGPGPLLGKR